MYFTKEEEREVNTKETVFGEMFGGHPISKDGRANKRVDYHAFSRAFNKVLSNGILNSTKGEWEQVSGFCDDEEYPKEIFQFFIVDDAGAELIYDFTNDPLFYNEELDMYVWGVTFWGMPWESVLTGIPCK